MKLSYRVCFAAAALLSAMLFVGCGGSSSSAASAAAPASASAAAEENGRSLDGILNAILDKNPISNRFTIEDMNIEYDFLLDPADIKAYQGVKSNDNGDAGLVLVLDTAEGKTSAVMDTLKEYREDQIAYYGNYAEFADAQANVRDCTITSSGSVVVLVIASSECSDPSSLSAAVSSALAG